MHTYVCMYVKIYVIYIEFNESFNGSIDLHTYVCINYNCICDPPPGKPASHSNWRDYLLKIL